MNDAECTPGRLRRGMCERHYRRWLTSGSTASPHIDVLRNYRVVGECWVWQGARWRNGYGKTSRKFHGSRLAHRVFYAEHVGPLPVGMDLDHLCHNRDATCVRGERCEHRLCVNPAHLEPVSRVTNLVRAINARTECRAGHDLTIAGAVLPGTKQCKVCLSARNRRGRERYLAKRRERTIRPTRAE